MQAISLVTWALAAVLIAPGAGVLLAPGAAAAEQRLALWVLAEGSQRVLERPERIPDLIEDARALGATDLYVQVYRRGYAWWPTDVAELAPRFAAVLDERPAGSPTPLAELLAAAHAAGLRVHAWINVLSLASNADAKILRDLGPRVLQVDRRGRSIRDYPKREIPAPDSEFLRMGTPAVWIDPAAPGVASWHRRLVAELFARHPSFDGLHLDYIRYPDVLPFAPGSRFGAGPRLRLRRGDSRARFRLRDGPRGALPGRRSPRTRNRMGRLAPGSGDLAAWWPCAFGMRRARLPTADSELSAAVWAYAEPRLSLASTRTGGRLARHRASLDFAVPMALHARRPRLLRPPGGQLLAGCPERRPRLGRASAAGSSGKHARAGGGPAARDRDATRGSAAEALLLVGRHRRGARAEVRRWRAEAKLNGRDSAPRSAPRRSSQRSDATDRAVEPLSPGAGMHPGRLDLDALRLRAAAPNALPSTPAARARRRRA